MFKNKIALFAAGSLLCAGFAMAQTADSATQPPPVVQDHHHADFAAMHKAMCEDHQAVAAAKLAFVEVKLDLTEAQKPLFAKWRQTVLDSAAKNKATCLADAPKTDVKEMPTILEREAHEETALQARLDMLKTTRPALQAFYDSLSDAQKETFNHLHHHHGLHGHEGMGQEGWGDHPFMHRPQ